MNLNIAQILLLAALIFFVITAIKKYRRKLLQLNELILTIVFWGVAGVIIIFPFLTQLAASKVGIGRGVDLMIYISLLVLFYFTFYILGRQRETDERLTKLAREIALMDPKKKE